MEYFILEYIIIFCHNLSVHVIFYFITRVPKIVLLSTGRLRKICSRPERQDFKKISAGLLFYYYFFNFFAQFFLYAQDPAFTVCKL